MPSTRNTRRSKAKPAPRFTICIKPSRFHTGRMTLDVCDDNDRSVVSAETLCNGAVKTAKVMTYIPGLLPYGFTFATVDDYAAQLVVRDILGPLDFAATRRTPHAGPARGGRVNAPTQQNTEAVARRVSLGIAATVACEQFAIVDPVTEIPALLNIAFAASRHLEAAEKAMAGDDIPAYVTASNRLRELLETFRGTESGDAL